LHPTQLVKNPRTAKLDDSHSESSTS
jgi:hypothetical protein